MSSKEVQHEGFVVWFDNKSGYGFLEWAISGVKQKDMFVHFSDINCEGFKTVKKGQRVSFDVGTNNRGQPKAVTVTVLSE